MNPDETTNMPTDPGMLQSLLELLGGMVSPSSAEAAGPTFQQRQQLEQQKLVQQLQILQERARIADTSRNQDQLRQAQIARTQATTQKTQASLTPQRSLESILSGGESTQLRPTGTTMFLPGGQYISGAGPGQETWKPPDEFGYSGEKGLYPISPDTGSSDILIRALTPETGTPFFGNVMPSWAAPEDQAAFQRMMGERKQAQVKPSAETTKPTEGKMSPADVAKMAEVSTALDKAKVPADVKSMIIQQSFPQYKAQQEAEKQTLRRETQQDQADIARRNLREKFVMENQSNLFKRRTGESFLGQGKPPENTEQILKDYAVLKPENAKDMRQLDMVGGYVDSFKNLLTKIKPLLASQKGGISGRIGAGTGIAYLRAQGNADVREMDALTAQITLLARGFGGDSRVSDAEMARLDKAIITGWTTKEGADSTLGVLDDFIKNRSSSLGFSQYKTMGQRPKQEQTLEQQDILRNKDKKGRPIISRDNGLNWEYE